MRATVLYGAGNVRVENVPDARLIAPTDALLEAHIARAVENRSSHVHIVYPGFLYSCSAFSTMSGL